MVRLTYYCRFDSSHTYIHIYFSSFSNACPMCIAWVCVKTRPHCCDYVEEVKTPKIHSKTNTMCELLGISLLSMLVSISLFRLFAYAWLRRFRPNCNILRIEILRVRTYTQALKLTLTFTYIVCTLSAHLTQSTFFCIVYRFFLFGFYTWFCLHCVSSMCLSDNIFSFFPTLFSVCSTIFLFLLIAKPNSLKMPISLWKCISFI